MSDITPPVPSPVPQPPQQMNNTIAFVIDGVVQDIIHVADRFNAILTSNPTIVSVPTGTTIDIGYSYSAENGFQSPTAG